MGKKRKRPQQSPPEEGEDAADHGVPEEGSVRKAPVPPSSSSTSTRKHEPTSTAEGEGQGPEADSKKKKKKKKKKKDKARKEEEDEQEEGPDDREALASPSSKPGPSSSYRGKTSSSSSSSHHHRPIATGTVSYPWKVDYSDHFETSPQAYADLEPALFQLSKAMRFPAKSAMHIYDPYYCQGAVRKHLVKLGFADDHIIHEKRDFYKDVAAGRVPQYDCLISNPPYSLDHKERCLDFCLQSGKPWCLLLPNYIANKSYFKELLKEHGASVFFIVPRKSYDFSHPDSTGHETSPFFSLWYVSLGQHQQAVLEGLEKWRRSQTKKGLSLGWEVKLSLEELHEAKAVPTWKRPSNKRRKKLKQKAMSMQQPQQA